MTLPPNGIYADARTTSGADFLRMVMGKPQLTKEQREQHERDREAWIAWKRAENRKELEELRDRLCALATPELAAEWRTKWSKEDAEAEAREQRKAA
jgi:hypothetical protein